MKPRNTQKHETVMVFLAVRQLSGLTRHTQAAYSVIEEIVEGFLTEVGSESRRAATPKSLKTAQSSQKYIVDANGPTCQGELVMIEGEKLFHIRATSVK